MHLCLTLSNEALRTLYKGQIITISTLTELFSVPITQII